MGNKYILVHDIPFYPTTYYFDTSEEAYDSYLDLVQDDTFDYTEETITLSKIIMKCTKGEV